MSKNNWDATLTEIDQMPEGWAKNAFLVTYIEKHVSEEAASEALEKLGHGGYTAYELIQELEA